MDTLLGLDVVRTLAAPPELRAAAADEGLGLLTGHFSTFNEWYRVASLWEGDFLERTAPGFTAQTIAEDRAGMRVLFNHGFDMSTGDKVLGPIKNLREDSTGAYYEVSLFDTSYNRDLLPGLRAGVYGASFRMQVMEDAWNDEPDPSDYNPKGLPERTITRAKVMEFGPVTFPANPGATASVRSATDEFYDRLRQRDRQAYAGAVRAAGRRVPALRSKAVTRATDASPQELAAAADKVLDQLEMVHDSGDHEGTAALITALDEIVDGLMTALGVPDTDEGMDDQAPMQPAGMQMPMGPRSAAHTDFTGRHGARSASGGGKDDEPGSGATSARTEAEARHHQLKLLGVLK